MNQKIISVSKSNMANMNKKSLLLIGAGPTNALISYAIASNQILRNAIDINVWEKAGGIGGRFATSRSRKNAECYADLGAQYLTRSLDHPTSNLYFENLKTNELLRPLEVSGIPGFRSNPRQEHYACTHGTASIVKHFFQQASVQRSDMIFNQRVTKIKPLPSGKVEVTAENQAKNMFDIVISTMPVPQILQLDSSKELITDSNLQRRLENVKYSTRFALGLFFDEPKVLTSSKHPINFVENDPIFRYWCIENLKRSGTFGEPTSVVMHTNINFGAANAEEDKDAMKPKLLQKACDIVPEAASLSDSSVKSHKWKFSQVLEPYEGKPGCIKISENVYAAGDGFSASGIEGCIDSAEKTIALLKAALNA